MVTLCPWSRLVTYDHPTSTVICHPWSPLIAHGHLVLLSPAIYDHPWSLPATQHPWSPVTHGHQWSPMVICHHGHLQSPQSPIVHGHLLLRVSHGHLWSTWSFSIQGQLSLLVTHGHFWSPMVTSGHQTPMVTCHPLSPMVTSGHSPCMLFRVTCPTPLSHLCSPLTPHHPKSVTWVTQ